MIRRDHARIALALLLIASIVALAWAAGAGHATTFDEALMRGAAAIPDAVAGPVTRLGDTIVRIAIAAVAAAALLLARDRAGAGFAAGAVIGGGLFNASLKAVFARPRPDLLPHLDIVNSSSFPSGHAAGAMVLAATLAIVAIRHGASRSMVWSLALVFSALVGISRVALAVHWPSDVLAGWASGALWMLVCVLLLDRCARSRHAGPR